jgi:hypothetical protein
MKYSCGKRSCKNRSANSPPAADTVPGTAWSLPELERKIPAKLLDRPAYIYVVTTAELLPNGAFNQTGSAPNFNGGRITLCTCKHKDRSSPPPQNCRGPNPQDPWQDVWVGGICSATVLRPRALFYLMLIEKTYANHQIIWSALGGPKAKSAYRNPIGDIYEPLASAASNPWSQNSYQPRLSTHVHAKNARTHDIEQSFYRPARHPRLFLGDKRRSHLWSSPTITLQPSADRDWKTAHHRFYEHLSDFLAILQ